MDYVKAFRPEELVELLVRAKGIDVVAINVRDQCTWTDHLIITTARSKQHLRALAGAVLHAVKARTEYVAGGQLQPVVEGKETAATTTGSPSMRVAWCTCSLPMVARGTI